MGSKFWKMGSEFEKKWALNSGKRTPKNEKWVPNSGKWAQKTENWAPKFGKWALKTKITMYYVSLFHPLQTYLVRKNIQVKSEQRKESEI